MKNAKLSLKFFIVVFLFTTQFSNVSAQYQHAARIQKATIIKIFGIRIGDNYSELESILLLSTCCGFVFEQAQEQILVAKDKANDDDILNSRNIYAPETINVVDEFIKGAPFFLPQQFDDSLKKNKDDNDNDVYETILLHD